MRLSHETGIATLIQFIVLAFLNIGNTIYSSVTTCTHNSDQCAINVILSIVVYILQIIWFGLIAVLGYLAQTRRDKRNVRFLIIAEVIVFCWAGVNLKIGISNHSDALSLFTSFFDLIFSVWVITLAYKLLKSRGGRVVRKRREPIS